MNGACALMTISVPTISAALSDSQAYVLVETSLVPATETWPGIAILAFLLTVAAIVGLRAWRL